MSEQTKKITAWAWRSGLIEFGDEMPEGALPVISGDEMVVREVVEILANDSWRGLVVPGVAWAVDGNAAVDLLIDFTRRVHRMYENHPQELH